MVSPVFRGSILFADLFTLHIVGIDIVVNWNEVLRQTNLRRFRAYKSCLNISLHEPH